MPLVFCPLASGSKGNCLFLQTDKSKLLIDLGLSFRQLQKRLSEIGEDVENIDAVMITHEHMDHISGLKVFSEKTNVPILVNADTAKGIYHSLHKLLNFKIFTTNEEFAFQDVKIDPFTIQHDTLDPVGFVIKTKKHKIGICADLGIVTSLVKKKLQKCDLLYIEANHEVDHVYSSARPEIYKERVLGRQGHLSNEECALLIKEVHHEDLKTVYLAHLSSECNSPQRALKTIQDILQKDKLNIKLFVAHQGKVSDIVKL